MNYKLITKKNEYNLDKDILVMGILNLTPDSFSDGGNYQSVDEAINRAKEMVKEGAHIIDIGAESTNPNSKFVDEKEELERLLPVITRLVKEIEVPISIDTYKASVAKACIEAGADIINDITGFKGDKEMARVVAENNLPCILMHMRGTPQNIHIETKYDDIIKEVSNELQECIDIALKAGVKKENIILDPGIGFNKSVDENIKLIDKLSELKKLGYPILMAASRKRFVGEILNASVNERVEGNLAVSVISAREGAHIIRVHEVKETVKGLKIVNYIKKLNRNKGEIHG